MIPQTVRVSFHQSELDYGLPSRDAREVWRGRAIGYLREFVARRPSEFLAEQVREFAEARGFDAPPDARSWGGVMQQARRDGIVRACGYAPARSSNGSAKVLWRAA